MEILADSADDTGRDNDGMSMKESVRQLVIKVAEMSGAIHQLIEEVPTLRASVIS